MGRQWRQCCSAKCPLHADGPIIGSVVCGLVLRPPTSNSMHCRSSSICPLQCPMCSPPNQSRAVFTLSLTVTFDHDCRTKTEYRQNGQIAPLEKARDCPERIPPTRDGDGWVLNDYCTVSIIMMVMVWLLRSPVPLYLYTAPPFTLPALLLTTTTTTTIFSKQKLGESRLVSVVPGRPCWGKLSKILVWPHYSTNALVLVPSWVPSSLLLV